MTASGLLQFAFYLAVVFVCAAAFLVWFSLKR